MKKHLNTLFVSTQGSYLSKDGECVLIRVEREDKARIPIHTLGGVVDPALQKCTNRHSESAPP